MKYPCQLTRRQFLQFVSATTASVALTDCAVNPVTGQNQLMLVSEAEEIKVDQEKSPHQFSADYGALQDQAVNQYIHQVGQSLASHSHRPQIPYSFRGVNAVYANAYAFPGGSIAATRGILIRLDNESELAALLGHEIGHVNARHTASQMSKGILVGTLVAVGTAVAHAKDERYAPLIEAAGAIGAGALLAHYSRTDERQADALGMGYMTRLDYNPQGMVGLMETLKAMSNHQPNLIEVMFATHPMSEERYQTAKTTTLTTYKSAQSNTLGKERYMDQIAHLRAQKEAIEAMQKGEESMQKTQYSQAETHLKAALQQLPEDYTALVMMAKCQVAQEKSHEALAYAEQAKHVYPTEAQGHQMSGIAHMINDKPNRAYEDFSRYEALLSGNPNIVFFKGLALEEMQMTQDAADEYRRYLQMAPKGEQADYVRKKLAAWKY